MALGDAVWLLAIVCNFEVAFFCVFYACRQGVLLFAFDELKLDSPFN